jgi:hypothetical protein
VSRYAWGSNGFLILVFLIFIVDGRKRGPGHSFTRHKYTINLAISLLFKIAQFRFLLGIRFSLCGWPTFAAERCLGIPTSSFSLKIRDNLTPALNSRVLWPGVGRSAFNLTSI